LAVALVACGGSSPTDTRTTIGNDVSIDVPIAPGSSQTFRLAGIERGRGAVGVVLAHMLGSSQSAWSPLDSELADEGFHVLTFDFRGHGLSGGDRNPSRAGLDLAAAVAKLRSLGAKRVLVVGASMGGTAAISVAAGSDLAGVVTISAPSQIGTLNAGAAVRKLAEPALFIVGAGDDDRYTSAARAFYAAAREPKRLAVIAGSPAHGTDLLIDKKVGSRVQKLIKDFLIANRG